MTPDEQGEMAALEMMVRTLLGRLAPRSRGTTYAELQANLDNATNQMVANGVNAAEIKAYRNKVSSFWR